MWKAYIMYRCPKCGHRIQSAEKIYKFDEDDYHGAAFAQARHQHRILDAVQGRSCPICQVPLEFAGWTDD